MTTFVKYLFNLSLLWICLGFYACNFTPSQDEWGKPNIVVVYADDLGWSDVGYNGATFYETPNIDRIAEEGLICTRFYPSAANCAPSRASMLTGMYAPRHEVYLPQGLSRGGDTSKMRLKTPTWDAGPSYFTAFDVNINQVDSGFLSLAELLNKAGYATARFGKWHIGGDNQGFDVNSAAGISGETTNRTVTYQITEGITVTGGKEKRYYSDTLVAERLTKAAVDFMVKNKDNPFFVFLSHWEVHTPLAGRKDRIDYYKNKMEQGGFTGVDPVYAAEIEQIDKSVGKINITLKELGILDETIVIFTSDNGGLSAITSNGPLRAGKGTFYEGGIRTPFCIRWPAVIEPASETCIPVSGIDLMPTFAEIANVPLPKDQPVDGVSLMPVFRGEQSPDIAHRSMFFHFPLYLGGGGPDKVLPTYDGRENYWRAVPLSVIIKGNWKLIHYYEYGSTELYNLKTDISETTDLTEAKPEVVRELESELHRWIEDVNAPVPHP